MASGVFALGCGRGGEFLLLYLLLVLLLLVLVEALELGGSGCVVRQQGVGG